MYEFGVDFVARCLAGEALSKAGDAELNLVAGDNIDISYNAQTDETTISNTMEVDNALSLSSENPVQNKVITDELRYKPDTYTGSARTANQKIVQLTRAEYDAIRVKDPNTYYMITDDMAPINVRTAYVPLDPSTDLTKARVSDNKIQFTFDAPDNFSLIEVRVSYAMTFTCGHWQQSTHNFTDVLSIPSSEASTFREGRKIYTNLLTDAWIGEAPNQVHINKMIDSLSGANFIYYNPATKKVTIEIGNLSAPYVNYIDDYPDNTTLYLDDVNIETFGYIAYGADNIQITETSYSAGAGIDINQNGVISLAADYGSSIEMSIDPDTYIITTVLKDQNGVQLGQAQTIDLPLESVVVSGRYDSNTKTIILTLEGGSTISIPVGDLVSGLESVSNKVTTIGSSSTNTEYPSAKAVYDALENLDPLPSSTSADSGKVLTVDGSGNAVWSTPSQGVTDYDLLTHRPSINNVVLTGNKTSSDLGLVETSDLNDYLTTSSAANTYQTKTAMSNYLTTTDAAATYQAKGNYVVPADIADMATETWVGQQGFLTSADEVPTVGPTDAGKALKATYSGGVGSYGWETIKEVPTAVAGDLGKVLTCAGAGTYGWAAIPVPSVDEVPTVTQNDDGKVLTAAVDSVSGITSYGWQTPSGGGGSGLQVETDGTNYWITVNGIRLYFASSAPTGIIPDGSMGIGW